MNNSIITRKNLTIKVKESKLFDSLLSFQTFVVDNWEDIESYIKQHPNYKDKRTRPKTKRNHGIQRDENYIYYYHLEKSECIKLGFPMRKQYLEFCSKHKDQLESIHDKETLFETIKKLMLISSETTDNPSLDQC